jgi:hypothetical protein
MKTYAYTTTRGATQVVPANIHKMIQKGMRFGHTAGELNRNCKFTLVDGTEVKATKTAEKVTVTKVTKPVAKVTAKAPVAKVAKTTAPKVSGKSNADLIRVKIADVKAKGGFIEDVIAYGMNELHQSKSQAQTYAKNNWAKV